MSRCKPRASRSSAGFTLLEVLLAITIVSMIGALLAASLQLAIQTWEKGEVRIEQIERTRHLVEFLVEDIRAAHQYTNNFANEGGGSSNIGAFFGDADRVNFISTSPFLSGQTIASGLREVSYWVEPGKGLVLREAPLLHTELFSEERGVVVTVAPAVRRVRFEYLYQNYSRVTHSLDNIWTENWGDIDTLSSATGISASLNFADENVRSYSLRRMPAAVRATLHVAEPQTDGTDRVIELGPVTIPILEAQLFEPRRQ